MNHGVDILAWHKSKSPQARLALWRENLKAVNQLPMTSGSGRVSAMSADQAGAFFDRMLEHPLLPVANKHVPNGNCFADAMITHLEALRIGIDKPSMLKVFTVLDHETARNRYHAALAIRRDDGGWWVIDKLKNAPMKLEDYGGPGTYLAPANQFGPHGIFTEKYTAEHFFSWVSPSIGPKTGHIFRDAPLFGPFMKQVAAYFRQPKMVRAPSLETNLLRPATPRFSSTDRLTMADMAEHQARRGV